MASEDGGDDARVADLEAALMEAQAKAAESQAELERVLLQEGAGAGASGGGEPSTASDLDPLIPTPVTAQDEEVAAMKEQITTLTMEASAREDKLNAYVAKVSSSTQVFFLLLGDFSF